MAKTNVRGGRPQLGLRQLLRRLATMSKTAASRAYAVVNPIQSPRTRGIGIRHRFDVPSGTNGLRREHSAESVKTNPTRNRLPHHNKKGIIFLITKFSLFVRSRTGYYHLRLFPNENRKLSQFKYVPRTKTLANFLIFLTLKLKKQTLSNANIDHIILVAVDRPYRNEHTQNTPNTIYKHIPPFAHKHSTHKPTLQMHAHAQADLQRKKSKLGLNAQLQNMPNPIPTSNRTVAHKHLVYQTKLQ